MTGRVIVQSLKSFGESGKNIFEIVYFGSPIQ